MQISGINNYYQPKYNIQKQRKTANVSQNQMTPDSFMSELSFKSGYMIKVDGFQYIHNFKNINNPENRAFFEQLKKKLREVPYYGYHSLEIGLGKLSSNVIRNVYESCLDANDVVNKYAAQVLFNICRVSDKAARVNIGEDINKLFPEWNVKKEASKVFEEWGLDGVQTLLKYAKDKNGNHNINNLKFILFVDKKFENFGTPYDVTKFTEKCADENGVISEKTLERFKSVYQANGGSSLVYEMDKIKDISDKGMHLIEFIQSGISSDYNNKLRRDLLCMCDKLLEINTGKDKEKIYDIIYDNLDLIKYSIRTGHEDIISYWKSDNTPIFTKAMDKNKNLSSKNLEILFELLKNEEYELYEGSEFLKDKNGIIREENFVLYKKISEYVFDDKGDFVFFKDMSNLNNSIKEFRNADGILNEEFIDHFVEMCEKYDIHSPNSNIRILRSVLSAINKNEKINWETVDTLYKYALHEFRNSDKYADIEFSGNFVVDDFRDKATGKIDTDKLNLLKLYPGKSISEIEKMIKAKNEFQSYIKGYSELGNLYTADDMLELLRDMNEEGVLKGINMTIPIKDGDSSLLMYITDIFPTEENAKKYDKVIKILSSVDNINYNYKDAMGVSFLEKVMMSENFKLLDLIKNKKIEYYPELDYVFDNIQNPEFKEKVKGINIILSDTEGLTAKDIKTELQGIAFQNTARGK